MSVATLSNPQPSVAEATLKVGGFVPLSTTDWPDHLAAVVFVQGCPWRCHYCHNPALQPRGDHNPQVWLRVLDTLRQRQGLLDAVVFSGGEPTLDSGLPAAMETVKALGFKVGLHTAGLYPKRLAACLPLVDWVALDIKTEFDDYKAVTSVPRSGLPAQESLDLVLASGRACEFRTTWHPDLIDDVTLLRLARKLRASGVQQWVLQAYRPTPQTQASLGSEARQVPEALLERLRRVGPPITLR